MLKKIIIFPTDTVYGIAASIYDQKSIKQIYEIKGRDFNKQIAVLCANLKQVKEIAIVNEEAEKLSKAFWPGGVTLILPTTNPYYKLTKEKTVGIRIPNHQLALTILEKYGPLKTTSINKSGEAPLNDYQTIKERYGLIINEIYENKEDSLGVSSTVIDLTDGIKIIRVGNIKKEDVSKVLAIK